MWIVNQFNTLQHNGAPFTDIIPSHIYSALIILKIHGAAYQMVCKMALKKALPICRAWSVINVQGTNGRSAVDLLLVTPQRVERPPPEPTARSSIPLPRVCILANTGNTMPLTSRANTVDSMPK